MSPSAKFHLKIFMETKVMITEIKNIISFLFKTNKTMLWCSCLPSDFVEKPTDSENLSYF